MILGWWLRGLHGTLLRPARLVNGKRAWLVQLDDRKNPMAFRGRARVGERILQKLEPSGPPPPTARDPHQTP